MTLAVLGALISTFNKARADESSMIPFGAYSPECVEVEFCELRLNGVLGSSRRKSAFGIMFVHRPKD
jgi:hypothetical protein